MSKSTITLRTNITRDELNKNVKVGCSWHDDQIGEIRVIISSKGNIEIVFQNFTIGLFKNTDGSYSGFKIFENYGNVAIYAIHKIFLEHDIKHQVIHSLDSRYNKIKICSTVIKGGLFAKCDAMLEMSTLLTQGEYLNVEDSKVSFEIHLPTSADHPNAFTISPGVDDTTMSQVQSYAIHKMFEQNNIHHTYDNDVVTHISKRDIYQLISYQISNAISDAAFVSGQVCGTEEWEI